MRLFELHRDTDHTGVSGTGVVADGVEFDDGTVAVRWRGDCPSTVAWQDLASAKAIHGHGGSTRFVFLGYDGRPLGEAPEPADRTQRGFATYLSATDTYGKRIDVQQSSAALHDAVWIYADTGAAHLDPRFVNSPPKRFRIIRVETHTRYVAVIDSADIEGIDSGR